MLYIYICIYIYIIYIHIVYIIYIYVLYMVFVNIPVLYCMYFLYVFSLVTSAYTRMNIPATKWLGKQRSQFSASST